MKLLPSLAAAGTAFLLSTAAWSADLTQAELKTMLAQLDKAVQAHDSAGVGRLLAAHVKITIDMKSSGVPVMRMNKSEYMAQLRQGWSESQNYGYQRINTRIEIAPDGKSARITGTVKETIGLQGRNFTSTVDEVARVELIKGQPLMTEIQATLASIR